MFTGNVLANFTNNDSATISLLNKKLLGYEMIVVSSNNTAVENISKEFPLKRKISEKYQGELSYLESVSSKVFSLHKNDEVIPLHPEDKPWGLISIALGNSKNRNQFNDRVFFFQKKIKKEQLLVFRREKASTFGNGENNIMVQRFTKRSALL